MLLPIVYGTQYEYWSELEETIDNEIFIIVFQGSQTSVLNIEQLTTSAVQQATIIDNINVIEEMITYLLGGIVWWGRLVTTFQSIAFL